MLAQNKFKLLALLLLGIISINVDGQNPIEILVPRTASPAASVSQTIGISKITVSYSRPSVKKREIWGKQVPFGWNKQAFGLGNEAPWRAGANENTVIEFSHPAKVEGQIVAAGSYGLFFVVNNDNTGEVILSKEYRSWGSFFYEAKKDQLRAKISLRINPFVEILTYDFINIKKNSSELVLNWEMKQIPVKIEFNVDEIIMENAAQQLKSVTGFNWQGYSSAANYALQNKVNQEKAIEWINVAIARNKSFGNYSTKAGLLRQLEKNAEADKIMDEAMKLTGITEAELNQYGYQLLGVGQIDKAIEIFLLATQRFPNSANIWDSLGEAYVAKDDKPNAIKSFQKALTLNPPQATKENSEKFLKQLGAL